MADVKIYRGGTPEINYMWKTGDYSQFNPPFTYADASQILGLGNGLEDFLLPYRSHADGAYALGYFTLGMPIRPQQMGFQRNALMDANPQVGDIIRCLWVPEDHYATYLNFKVMGGDANMAGATVVPTAQSVVGSVGADGQVTYTYTEISDIADALTAQGFDTPIGLDVQSNLMLSLCDASSGYVQPLYSAPNRVIMIGLKVMSLPTNPEYSLVNMLNAAYLSVKMEGFECPMHY